MKHWCVGESDGVSLAEELAITGVSKSAFSSASESATGYKAFLNGVGKAQEKLGIQFTDSNGKMLPMVDVLDNFKSEFSDLQNVEVQDKIKEAFGFDDAKKIIMALIDKSGDLVKAQSDIEYAMANGMAKSDQIAKAMDRGYGFAKIGHSVEYLGLHLWQNIRACY
nr:phage tail tape measure protein [Abyssogena phaseoliformis symbiont]